VMTDEQEQVFETDTDTPAEGAEEQVLGTESADESAAEDTGENAAPETPDSDGDEAQELAKEYLTRLQHLQAEFDNYRKRQEREKTLLRELVTENNAIELLPVLDNFERALNAATHEQTTLEAHVQGMQMISKQLEGVLSSFNIRSMQALGEPFCPEKHEAVSKAPSSEYPEDTVMQVLQTGWVMDDKIIRHAVVIVSEGNPESDASNDGATDKEADNG
jgi:molecular chaperone GrpE